MAYKPIHAKPSALVKVVTRGGVIASAAAIVAAGAGAIGAGTADAATVTSASTYIANHPDSGDGGTWAYDDFTRTLTFAKAPDQSVCSGMPATGDTCYTAVIADSGKFNAIVGAADPNTSVSGSIQHSVQGTMTGWSGYTFYAPADDAPSYSNVGTYQNDNFKTSSNPAQTTPNWYLQLFSAADQSAVQGSENNDWTWTYKTPCGEQWTDSAANGGGDIAAAGNITGKDVCVTSHTGPGYVVNKNSGKALDVTGGNFAQGTPLQQWTEGAKSPSGVAGGDQKFEIVTENTGTSYLVAVDGSKDYYVTPGAKGYDLVLSTYPTSAAALDKSGSYYKFPNTGLVMDVTGRSKANGARVQGWPLNDGTNQQWSLP